jgi:hypothetical protein
MNLMEELEEKIIRHLSNIDLVKMASQKLLNSCIEGDIERIDFFSKNRGRLVNFVQNQQNEIEGIIDQYNTDLSTPEAVDILKAWIHDISIKTNDIANLDEDILSELNKEKDKTTQEIATTFKNKDKFKGYNLNKVR